MFEEIGETGIKILLYLHKNGCSKLGDFKDKAGISNAAIYNAIAILKGMELMTEHKEGKKRMFELTPFAQQMTAKIYEADKMLIEYRKGKRKP